MIWIIAERVYPRPIRQLCNEPGADPQAAACVQTFHPALSRGRHALGLLHRLARRFRRDQNGATALEFALVAPVFLAIVLGIVEVAQLFIMNVCVDTATASFAKQIRTGQVQAPGTAANSSSGAQLDLTDAKTSICQQIPLASLSACTSQLQLDIRPLTSYQQNAPSPMNGNQFNSAGLCYYSGNAGDIVEIRAYYLFPLIDPLLLATFSLITSYQSGSSLTLGNFFPIMTTQVFKAENYSSGSNTGAAC